MKLLYYNPRQNGNIGSTETEIPVSASINPNLYTEVITETRISVNLASNGNDKRLRLGYYAGYPIQAEQELFDTGNNLNGVGNDIVHLRIEFLGSGVMVIEVSAINNPYHERVVAKIPLSHSADNFRIFLTGEADNDIVAYEIKRWQLTEMPEFPLGLVG